MVPPTARTIREALFIVFLAIVIAVLHSLTSTAGLSLLKKALAFRG
jgi:hypothetical protein